MIQKIFSDRLVIEGITITVKRKQIKNLYLRVAPATAEVSITAPYAITDRQITAFVNSKMSWLTEKIADVKMRHVQTATDEVNETYLWLWGKQYKLCFLPGAYEEVKVDQDTIFFCYRKNNTGVLRKSRIEKYCRLILQEEIQRQLEHWQPRLGLYAEAFSVRKMKSLWGSCHVRKKCIVFNFFLIHRPKECLEYIVVHELAHLYEASHNKRFKDFLTAMMPDWKSRRRLLNDFAFNSSDNENLL